LDKLLEVAENVGRAITAINRIKKGKNTAALEELRRAVEKEAGRVVDMAVKIRRRRKRNNDGRFS
jgi:hypothetical protein